MSSKHLKSRGDDRHRSFYLPQETVDEMRIEAERLGRSLSWVAQRAWIKARGDIKAMPGDEP